MTTYMLSVHTTGEARPAPSEAEMRASWERIGLLERDLQAAGAWLLSARLHAADTATVVRHADGRVVTTDGPFVEAREHLGGFYLIEADDLDAALSWAARVSDCIGMPIEVRPATTRTTPGA